MDKSVASVVRQIPVHQIPLKDLYLAIEAPKGANLAVRDSGRSGPITDTELKASLEHIGLIYPLIFAVHEDKFYVVAGNRRLRFLREIHADNPDALMNCQNAADFPGGDWRGIAIDTNLSLPPHPVERYEQMVLWAREHEASSDDVRERFGLSHRQYSQIMALGGMAPQIREKWKAGEIDFKTAQLFTLEPNHKEQVRIYDLVAKQNGGHVYEHVLRMKIVPPNQAEAGRMVEFLGVDFCRQNKLIKQEDFFQTSHIVNDVKELQRIVADRLKAMCTVLQDKGWSWAIPESEIPAGERFNYFQLEPKGSGATKADKAKVKELEAELEKHETITDGERSFEDIESELEQLQEEIKQRGYTAEQKAKTGCILKINHRGQLEIEYGRVKPSDRRKIEAEQRSAERAKEKASGKGKAAKADEPALNNSLATRLSEGLQGAIAAALKEAPHVAVAALIAGAGSGGTVLDVRVKDAPPKWESGEKDFLQLFSGAVESTTNQQVAMLTQIAMQALDIVTHNASHMPLDGKALQAVVAKLPPAAVNRYIADNFNAEDYFKGVSLDMIVGAVRAAMGEDHAGKVAKMKKGDAVKFAVDNVTKKGWMPPELRTVHYKGPTEGKASPAARAKAEKPTPAKKAAKKAKKK